MVKDTIFQGSETVVKQCMDIGEDEEALVLNDGDD